MAAGQIHADKSEEQMAEGIGYAACPGTGEWAVDKANGDYANASFQS